jgi:hypothetical protein
MKRLAKLIVNRGPTQSMLNPDSNQTLKMETVGVAHIVFFVVAAAAPLTAVLEYLQQHFLSVTAPGFPALFC